MVQIDVESENGWRPPDLRPGAALLVWKTISGTNPPVNIQVMRGLPEVFQPAWEADWNEFIEPLRDRDTASYTDGNSVYTSNHKNGTATDSNYETHPFHGYSFTDEQLKTIHEMVDFYEGWMFWAGDWQDPIDQMHSQMGYNTWNRNTAALDFISRKIRSDGKSTFRRGALSANDPPNHGSDPAAPTPVTPENPSRDDPTNHTDSPAEVLYDAVPEFGTDDAVKFLPFIVGGLVFCKAKTPKSIAMYLAEMGEESGGFVYTEEIAKDGRYAPYIGRTWVQITWDYNYREFGQWCVEQGLLDDPEFFIKNPAKLADLQWAALGPAWYCTVKEPRYLEFAEAGDVENASKAINAPAWVGDDSKHANNIGNRWDRYNQAIALGDRLLLLLPKTDTPAPTDTGSGDYVPTQDEWNALVTDVKEIRKQLDGDWPQNSNDAKAASDLDKRKASGEKLTLNDMVAWLKNHVSTHKNPTP